MSRAVARLAGHDRPRSERLRATLTVNAGARAGERARRGRRASSSRSARALTAGAARRHAGAGAGRAHPLIVLGGGDETLPALVPRVAEAWSAGQQPGSGETLRTGPGGRAPGPPACAKPRAQANRKTAGADHARALEHPPRPPLGEHRQTTRGYSKKAHCVLNGTTRNQSLTRAPCALQVLFVAIASRRRIPRPSGGVRAGSGVDRDNPPRSVAEARAGRACQQNPEPSRPLGASRASVHHEKPRGAASPP